LSLSSPTSFCRLSMAAQLRRNSYVTTLPTDTRLRSKLSWPRWCLGKWPGRALIVERPVHKPLAPAQPVGYGNEVVETRGGLKHVSEVSQAQREDIVIAWRWAIRGLGFLVSRRQRCFRAMPFHPCELLTLPL
jgi:hypothetical protein